MMKIKLEQDDIKLIFEAEGRVSSSVSHKVVDNFYSLLNDLSTKKCSDSDENKSVPEPVQVVPQVAVERPAFRDRLPNNVVDIKDLTVKQAVTESALVRCPNCGQAHCLAVHDNGHIYFMARQYATNEFSIIAEFNEQSEKDKFMQMCCNEDTNRKAYYEDIQQAKTLPDIDFGVQNDTEIFCPVCCKSHSFQDWKKAFDEPLTFFETELLCDACGGEMLPKMVKGKSYQECDKCGHRTEYKEG